MRGRSNAAARHRNAAFGQILGCPDARTKSVSGRCPSGARSTRGCWHLDRRPGPVRPARVRSVSVHASQPTTMRVFEASISYRLVSPGENVRLNNASAIADYLRSAYEKNPVQEAFFAVFLSRRGHPIGRHLISLGTLTSTLVSAREVFRGAILANAATLVVSHNHPSGDPAPSNADIAVTRLLREASKTLEIDLLDHVVVGTKESDPLGKGFFSFREAGLL